MQSRISLHLTTVLAIQTLLAAAPIVTRWVEADGGASGGRPDPSLWHTDGARVHSTNERECEANLVGDVPRVTSLICFQRRSGARTFEPVMIGGHNSRTGADKDGERPIAGLMPPHF